MRLTNLGKELECPLCRCVEFGKRSDDTLVCSNCLNWFILQQTTPGTFQLIRQKKLLSGLFCYGCNTHSNLPALMAGDIIRCPTCSTTYVATSPTELKKIIVHASEPTYTFAVETRSERFEKVAKLLSE